MTDGHAIVLRDLTKTYGRKRAVDHLTTTIEPGRVTGFLGPNGAGKSTTMRLVLGLDHPDAGTATVGGRRYDELTEPLRMVGALLEARAWHTGRTAYDHLRFLAASQGLPQTRADEVLELVGLKATGSQRTKGFSLGMGQRLGIAAALIGDPRVLILDEPVNGLDPEGVRWIRTLLRQLAGEGRTVLLSSHLMNEMSLTADHLVVIGQGRLIADCGVEEFLHRNAPSFVRVSTPTPDLLTELLAARGGVVRTDAGALAVSGLDAAAIGELAVRAHIPLHELTPSRASLEDVFMELTRQDVDHPSGSRPAEHVPTLRSAS